MDKLKQIDRYIPYIIPVVGIFFFNWSAFAILLFFCIENILRGIFFLLRGIILVHYGGGVGFLIVFCFLYFAHASGMTQVVVYISDSLSILTIPSTEIIIINIIVLCIPLVQELFIFGSSIKQMQPILNQKNTSKDVKNGEMKKENMTPIINFILSIKEMFLRIFALWATIPFAFAIIMANYYFHFYSIVSSVLLILVFTFFHYLGDYFSLKDRQKAMDGYQSWKTGEVVTQKGNE